MRFLPNAVTLLRIILLFPYIYSLINGFYNEAFYLFILAGSSDCLDGYLARRFRWTSQLGAFIDPLADKLLMISSFMLLYGIGYLPFWVPCLFVLRDIIIIIGVVYIYYFHRETLKFEPITASKLNTVLQIVLIFTILFQLSYGPILPKNGIMVLIGIVMLTSMLSLIQYMWVWTKRVYHHL